MTRPDQNIRNNHTDNFPHEYLSCDSPDTCNYKLGIDICHTESFTHEQSSCDSPEQSPEQISHHRDYTRISSSVA